MEYLREVESRFLFAKRGYSSLQEFCIKELHYSETSAYRRISAMRMMKVLPEVKEKLEEGLVNLSTLSQLQSFIKREEKAKEAKISVEDKLTLLLTIENKSQAQCEKEFIKINPETAKTQDSLRH